MWSRHNRRKTRWLSRRPELQARVHDVPLAAVVLPLLYRCSHSSVYRSCAVPRCTQPVCVVFIVPPPLRSIQFVGPIFFRTFVSFSTATGQETSYTRTHVRTARGRHRGRARCATVVVPWLPQSRERESWRGGVIRWQQHTAGKLRFPPSCVARRRPFKKDF